MAYTNTKSKKLFERAQALFPGGVNSPVRAFKSVGLDPFIVERGSGAYLYDVDRNRYIDYVLSWGPLVLGHAHPSVVEALAAQLSRGTSFGACCEAEQQLAAVVISLFPSIERIRFVNSGTEAALSVLRLARAFTKRDKIVKFEGCYHGHVDSLLVSAGSGVATLSLPDSPGVLTHVAQNTLVLPFNDLERAAALLSAFPDQIAALIIEPVPGNCGLLEPKPGYLEGLRKLCDKFGVLLIFDEVMSGFRVALGGAQQLYQVRPDLSMLGKVIGGGLPVGAFGGRADIMSQLAPVGPVYQAGTLSGNPLAMLAGTATLKLWSADGLFERTARTTAQLTHGMLQLAAKHHVPLCSKSIGTMFGFFFQNGPVNSYQDAKKSDTLRFAKFFRLMLENGVYFAPSQFEAGFMSALHSPEMIEQTLATADAAFTNLAVTGHGDLGS